MSNTSTTTLYLFLLLISTTLLAPATTAVTCSTVSKTFVPCLGFVVGNVAKVPEACCSGLGQLVISAVTATDRQALCKCLTNAVKALPNVKDQYLRKLPEACGIRVTFPISLDANCDNVRILKSGSERDGQEMNKREIN
ncbi:Plant non-specific lipid-transfer protein/Par allergen protein [Dioscorea alata]|uniref:Plant non-specific lipid-transfer protein/Par allergen protein n=1 Tax=Dioscorea alata TaxID=55571 RepID=A0ACB7VHU1_DIOAL|nr:Plant non-specific lipid-transfer protein/Par allergen protein [Dioscorea alata]